MKLRTISDVIHKEGLVYALYTIEQRAIPNMIDGLKPVHRFFVYSANHGSNEFRKVAAVGGSVAEFGYHHGETSANEAGSILCAKWANNINLVDGRGFFGSRLVKSPSSPRYIYCKTSEMFNHIYQDMDLIPEHPDEEHEPPKHYLPIIPVVLMNGVYGIAKAYATNIPPHDPKSIVNACIQYLKGKDFSLEYKYPLFRGTIENGAMHGLYELHGKTKLIINEIPYKFNREKYNELLIDLEAKGYIVSYIDDSKEDFKYIVTLKREYAAKLTHEKIMKDFRLVENINPNINVILDGNLIHFDTPDDLLKRFVDYRLTVYQQRIDKKRVVIDQQLKKAKSKIIFIQRMIDQPDSLKGLTKKKAIELIDSWEGCEEPEYLVSMNIYHLTTDELEKLHQDVKKLEKELEYWKDATPSKVYLSDLTTLLKKM
ncbi:DNA topoisomerase subunit [Pectobacterium phage POP12]|nr:DNA topoisomerase subunit [Pectobacterium phage POP12]